jgi:predicted  nucleic acid-binding Zn-ribbon protein
MSYSWDEGEELLRAKERLRQLAQGDKGAVALVKAPYEDALQTLQTHVKLLKKEKKSIKEKIQTEEAFIAKVQTKLKAISSRATTNFHIT